jgi:hypothetical protein
MKPLMEYININEGDHKPDDYKEAGKIARECIKELEDAIGSVIGIRNLKLNVIVMPQKIAIESDNLLPQLKDGLWNVMFDDVRFETWGGEFTKDGKIWFNPKFSWNYARKSGSNGHDFGFYRNIWFDPNTKEWIFDK